MRSAPITPAKPTSITVRWLSTFSPTRKPTRKSVAAASAQTGQPLAIMPGRDPFLKPIHDVRTMRRSGGPRAPRPETPRG
jgi:hypothetical protein